MSRTLILIALIAFAQPLDAQSLEELFARLKSPVVADRADALVGLGKFKTPDAALLSVVAERLLDEAGEVRVSAAYSLGGIAGKMGCRFDRLPECKLFAGILDATPKISKRVFPKYPIQAKERREQGDVLAEFLVGEDGSVSNLRVLRGPPMLKEAAVESLKQSTYEPARMGGTPVPFVMVLTITFRLQ